MVMTTAAKVSNISMCLNVNLHTTLYVFFHIFQHKLRQVAQKQENM